MTKLSVNRFLYGTIVGIVLLFSLLLGLVILRNLEHFKKEAMENFAFRTELFKQSIDSNIILGDYVSGLKKADLFFSQSDVDILHISLIDGTSLVDLRKPDISKSLFEISKEIGISDDTNGDFSRIADLKIGYDLSPLDSVLRAIAWQGAGVLLAFLGVSAIGAFYLSKLLNQPLKNLSRLVAGGDLQKISSILSESKIFELWMLESAIAEMGGQLTSFHKKEVENAKSLAVAQVASQISHDLRAPLATIERLLYLPQETTIKSQAVSIKETLFRIGSMIDSFRNTDTELLVLPIWQVVDYSDCLGDLKAKAEIFGKKIFAEVATERKSVFVDGPKLKRAIYNLASNAIDAANFQISIRVFVMESDLYLKVEDDGFGVPEVFVPRLFQKNATFGKADGTGLGLAYVRQIMRGHGGDVTYRRENGLTIFECRLPNAVVEKEDQTVEIAAFLEIKLEQKQVKKVAICLDPPSLSQTVLAQLASHNSEEFLFSGELSGAHIVVSNIDEIMFQVLERDDQEFIQISESWGPETQMIGLLKRKLNLT